MITPKEFRNGLVVKMGNDLFSIVYFQHIKPGKGGAFIRTKLKNLRLHTVIDRTFREGDQLENVYVDQKNIQYLYRAGDHFHFMDTIDYEQIIIDKEDLDECVPYIKENDVLTANLHDGRIISLSVPIFVNLKVVHTEPGIRGNTAKGGSKAAELETGLVVQVPLFIDNNDILKIDTRTGEYVSRA